MSQKKGVAGQREEKLVPNVKFKALVLIPSRMDSVGGRCVSVRARVYVCFRVHS